MDKLNNVLETIREDDFVEYYLFPQIDRVAEIQQQKLLEGFLNKVNNVISKYTQHYLWHKDPVKFTIRTELSNYLTHIDGKNELLPPHLYGISHYGDNIEDEWFIVFLLQEISKKIAGIICRVYDADGEFLLIEAANFLPQWAKPESCEKRVYIYNGQIQLLIPENLENTEISVQNALEQIRNRAQDCDVIFGNSAIQSAIDQRLRIFPDNILNNLHHATVYIPRAIAAILKLNPLLVSPAVQAFCNRDSVDLKACRAMKYFPPEERVLARVKFTKCLYAMLLHSKYVPDRKTGWNLPAANSPEYKKEGLGVKLSCGFEILVSQAKPSEDVEGDRGWAQYLKSLEQNGYFKELLEGSKEYNNRFNKAKEYYVEHRDSMQYTPAIGEEILQILRNTSYEPLKNEENVLLEDDDDDSWLNISPEEVDKMLQERYGQKKLINVNASSDPSNFAEKINTFLNHVSDVDGVEFPSEENDNNAQNPPPIKPPRKKTGNKKGVTFSDQNNDANNKMNMKVDFDPESFVKALQDSLNLSIPEDDSWNLESDSEMSEYGEDDFVNATEINNANKNKMDKYMEQMDQELAATTMGKSFEKKVTTDKFDDIENFQPVDIDVNALKNILQSYQAQLGEAGPSSTMLGPMGINLEADK